jgi:hypothetical protein
MRQDRQLRGLAVRDENGRKNLPTHTGRTGEKQAGMTSITEDTSSKRLGLKQFRHTSGSGTTSFSDK